MKRVVVGLSPVLQALRDAPGQVAVVYADSLSGAERSELNRLASARKVRCEQRAREELDALAGSARHAGVLAITGEYPYVALDQLLEQAGAAPLLVALDQVTDPHNFGAIVRSAVGFGADGLITLKDRAAPVTPVVVRAAAGATELTRIARVTNLARTLEGLRDDGFEIVGLDMAGTVELSALPYPAQGRVLVVGSEGDGLRRLVRERCEMLARIPMASALQSLNVSVATAIALYECMRARHVSSG